ncbi:DinB family protein [Flavobacterium sp. GT3R68]|uniref:DinB family protein n=1 Tax=Flavobacterium sp. GT3R68 TaxID=2594437 RepID=UPI000F87ECD7|nr:DinB family protein [Flavobacterium sp. GT3R68]RTY89853.1 DinB family protein [Flavobacterium sp. GSN2]TRW89832.1 DinB family protein [Flavobacterium sp. GT3R68]
MITNKNAVHALLSEYKKAILELQHAIQNISVEDLTFIVDTKTDNPDCQSIQTVLSHVVRSGYSYCVYIRNLRNENVLCPEKTNRGSISEYLTDLNNVLKFTHETFHTISDKELERFKESEKIKTSWEQVYDIEQMMEHAIVHVLRHRLQIENFKAKM